MLVDLSPRVLGDFEGHWRLERAITHADGTEASFKGTAEWRAAPGGMIYHETGYLQMVQGPKMQAERRYQWGDDLDVYFEDGRFFHRVPALGGDATHWCDPDTYDVNYDFSKWPCFSALWRVRGPKKAYSMHSHYQRL